jgi:hypothetical protein
MCITKLKDGPKRVKKMFSMILEKDFWNGVMEGEKMKSHRKGFEETLGAFLSLPLFSSLERFWWYLRRKSLLQKLLFKWLQYTGGGRIFWNGVMHANMAKPWLWRWGSGGYMGGGRIFWSGVMHTNIFGWG